MFKIYSFLITIFYIKTNVIVNVTNVVKIIQINQNLFFFFNGLFHNANFCKISLFYANLFSRFTIWIRAVLFSVGRIEVIIIFLYRVSL